MTDKLIYFDHAATNWPKSERVTAAIFDCLSHAGGNPGRSGHALALAADGVLFDARGEVCRLLGTSDPSRVVLTPGATFAINLAFSVFFPRRGKILIGDMEHNAVWRTAVRMAEERGGTVSVFRAGDLDDFAQKLRGASLVATLHASNVTGDVYPLGDMIALCHSRGVPIVVDAAQSAGHLPLGEIAGADAVCLPGHKALGGIQGAGAVFFRDGKDLPPFLSGGSGTHSLSPYMPEELPDRFEAGTPPTPAIAAMAEGIRENLPRIGDGKTEAVTRRAAELLGEFSGITLLGGGDFRCGILSFTLQGRPSEDVAAALSDRGICVRGGFHCAALAHRTLGTDTDGCVRLSFGRENTEEELLILRDAMREIAER